MTLKQFLKPGWKKIVIFFIILLLTLFLGIKFSAIPEIDIIYEIGYPAFLTITTIMFGRKIYEWNFPNLIINIVIWYLLSCLIVWIYEKVKGKKK